MAMGTLQVVQRAQAPHRVSARVPLRDPMAVLFQGSFKGSVAVLFQGSCKGLLKGVL